MLPASGSSAISASVSVSVALMMYGVPRSGPPKATPVPRETGRSMIRSICPSGS
jgi:hypothetical protein